MNIETAEALAEPTPTLTYEAVMAQVESLLASRVALGVGYLQDNKTGLLTHSYMTVDVGPLSLHSEPALLISPLMTVELGKKTVN